MRRTPLRRKAIKPKRSTVAARKGRWEKRCTMAAAMTTLRKVVVERAGRWCECGCGTSFGDGEATAELDHVFGRLGEQSIRTCWLLVRAHHRDKTENKPHRAWWFWRFREHCLKFGYEEEAGRAARESLWATAKAEASARRRRR